MAQRIEFDVFYELRNPFQTFPFRRKYQAKEDYYREGWLVWRKNMNGNSEFIYAKRM